MAIDSFTYSVADSAKITAEKSLMNARQWASNTTYEAGVTCIFNNSFYVANYSHDSGASFNYSAWTKINNSADAIKNLTVDDSAKLNGRALVYDSTTDRLVFRDVTSGSSVSIDTDVTLSSNSDATTSSTRAVKTYVDNRFASVATGSAYKGTLDISIGVLPSDIKLGDWYRVVNNNTVSGVELNNGDMIVANKTKSGSTTIIDWDKIDNTEATDILRVGNISANSDLNIESGKLADRSTIKTILDNLVGDKSQLPTTDKSNIINAIKEVFINGSNVKSNIASALTAKGSTVTTQNTWSEIVGAINNLSVGGTANIIQVTKLNVVGSTTTPYIRTEVLSQPVQDSLILATVRELVGNTQNTQVASNFNNTDATNFQYNNGKVMFDGTMKIAPINEIGNMTEISSNIWSYSITKSEYNSIDLISVDDSEEIPVLTLVGTNPPQVIKAIGDIDISGIQSLDKILMNSTSTFNGKVLLAISVDGGLTYKAYNSGSSSWVTVDVDNIEDFEAKGMTRTISDSLGTTELELLRGGSNSIRFAYYLSVYDNTSTASVDSISVTVLMSGNYQLANKTDYDITIGEDNQSIVFKIYKNGTFTINYKD